MNRLYTQRWNSIYVCPQSCYAVFYATVDLCSPDRNTSHHRWPHDHIAPSLQQLHWFQIHGRIHFKICTTYTLGRHTSMVTPCSSNLIRKSLRSASKENLVCARSCLQFGNRVFRLMAHWSGAALQSRSVVQQQLDNSSHNWKRTYSHLVIHWSFHFMYLCSA